MLDTLQRSVFSWQMVHILDVGLIKAGHEGPAFICWREITDNRLDS
jgi:hypothetical protein